MKPKLGVMGNMCWLVEDVNIPETIAIQTNQPIMPSYPETTLDHPTAAFNDGKSKSNVQNWGEPKNKKSE
jgi:hypothetical protein